MTAAFIIKLLITIIVLGFVDFVIAIRKYEKEDDEEKRDALWERVSKKVERLINGLIVVLFISLIGMWLS